MAMKRTACDGTGQVPDGWETIYKKTCPACKGTGIQQSLAALDTAEPTPAPEADTPQVVARIRKFLEPNKLAMFYSEGFWHIRKVGVEGGLCGADLYGLAVAYDPMGTVPVCPKCQSIADNAKSEADTPQAHTMTAAVEVDDNKPDLKSETIINLGHSIMERDTHIAELEAQLAAEKARADKLEAAARAYVDKMSRDNFDALVAALKGAE